MNNTLLIYSPQRYLQKQFLRPTELDITEEVQDDILENATQVTCGYAESYSNSIFTSIIPGSKIEIKNDLQALWSFALFLNDNGKKRIISGYFLGEPVAPNTMHLTQPVVNTQAIMVITNSINLQKYKNRIVTNQVADRMGQNLQGFAEEGLYLNSNKNLVQSINRLISGDSKDSNDGNLLSLHDSQFNKNLNIPFQQIRTITDMVGVGLDVNDGYPDYDELINSNDVLTTMQLNASGQELIIDNQLLSSNYILLNDIMKQYPNLAIQPITIEEQPYDKIDQGIENPGVNFCNMLASSIMPIASASNIGNISFKYESYGNNTVNGVCTSSDNWKIFEASFITEAGQTEQANSIFRFKQRLLSEVFPVIASLSGHFELTVMYNLTGYTSLSLSCLDYEILNGYVQIPNMFSAILNPSLSNSNTFHYNIDQMFNLLNAADVLPMPGEQHSMTLPEASLPFEEDEMINIEEELDINNFTMSDKKPKQEVVDLNDLLATR